MGGSHVIAQGLFLRLLGVVYFLAFASLGVQVRGLYGSRGILPVAAYIAAVRRELGRRGILYAPTLFWLANCDRALVGSALLGMAFALLLAAGVAPVAMLVLLWLLYLSFVTVGQEFLSYQWDALLLETGFMAVFFSLAAPPPLLVMAAWWFFLFRFMFSAGWVKLASGDPNWRNLRALCYHYESQPLPNRIGWFAHHLPEPVQRLSTIGTFFFELAVPFLALGPAPVRLAACALLLFFQLVIFATGNYGFFNLLAMLLCVPLLDDRYLSPLGVWPSVPATAGSGPAVTVVIAVVFALFIVLNLLQFIRLFWRPAWLSRLLTLPELARVTSPYGLFAVMTTGRLEFIIEGSDDLMEWRPYGFRWKPGDLRRVPRQAAPHQPRLDWQMWFAALEPLMIEPWLKNLLLRLLEGSPSVLALFREVPFREAPPRYVRLVLYRYRFSTLRTLRAHGEWWERTLIDAYPPMMLKRHAGETT
jgi:hypothetical protein